MPTVYTQACLHAAIRWDRARRLTGNDLYDLHHASSALAHCQAFLTEHPLRSLVTSNHLALDKLFSCRVISGVPEAIAFLKSVQPEKQL